LRSTSLEDSTDPTRTFFRNYGLFGGSNRSGHLPAYAHVVNDRIMLIDIDTENDIRAAESVLRAGIFDFDSTSTGHDI